MGFSLKKFQQDRTIENLEEITRGVLKIIDQNDKNLSSIFPAPAEMMIGVYDKNYI